MPNPRSCFVPAAAQERGCEKMPRYSGPRSLSLIHIQITSSCSPKYHCGSDPWGIAFPTDPKAVLQPLRQHRWFSVRATFPNLSMLCDEHPCRDGYKQRFTLGRAAVALRVSALRDGGEKGYLIVSRRRARLIRSPAGNPPL